MPIPTIDFESFHRVELPSRLAAGNGALAHDDVADVGPLGIRLASTGSVFTYVPVDGSIDVVAGDGPARTVIELDQDAWDGLAQDLETAPGLLYGNRMTSAKGSPLRFVEWEPALRAMYHGRPIFDPATADLRDRDGAPLDVERTFTSDDVSHEPDEVRHFFRTAGYLAVRRVFSAVEVAELVAAAEELAAEAREGDQQSWWGRTADGEAALCRVLDAGRKEAIARLQLDERLAAIARLADEAMVPRGYSTPAGGTVLWKRPGMVEGLGDLPWHRDCGMGGHATMCPRLNATVCLTAGGPEAGELRVLPGSHAGSFHFIDGTDPEAPTGVGLAVGAGDVTFHYSDLAHVSMPPTSTDGPFRVSALVGFGRPESHNHRGSGHYNDVLLGSDDGQVEHLRDKVQRETVVRDASRR